MSRAWLLSIVLVTACGQGRIEAVEPTTDADHDALVAAIGGFVDAGKTPRAYRELAAVSRALTAPAARREAELRLIVLALGPVRAMRGSSLADQVDALALTVWPTLLEVPFDVDARVAFAPRPGDDPQRYIRRLCEGPLAAACGHAGAEHQAAIVYALAIHRASARAHAAIDRCLACASDPDWHAASLAWETLDRGAEHQLVDLEAAGFHDRPGV